METRYGPSVCVTLQLEGEVKKVFLPKRFAELSDEDLESMNAATGLTLEKKRGDERSPAIVFSCLDGDDSA